MKLHSCVKTGGGVPSPPEPNSQLAASESRTCQPVTYQPATISQSVTLTPCRHIDRLSRRCRMLSLGPDLELCPITPASSKA